MADLSFNFAADDGATIPLRRPINKGGKWASRVKLKQTVKRKEQSRQAKITAEAVAPIPAIPVETRQLHDEPDLPSVPEADPRTQTKRSQETKVKEPTSKTPSRVISSLFSSREHLTQPNRQRNEEHKNVSEASNAPGQGTFEALGLIPPLVARLKSDALSLLRPTGVQQAAVPLLIDGCSQGNRDFVVQAQTGSGKTLAYLLPLVQSLLSLERALHKERGTHLDRSVGTFAIVLVPTRELAQQVYQVAVHLLAFTQVDRKGKQRASADDDAEELDNTKDDINTRWLVPGLLTGGMHRQHEKARLRKGVPLLIATPGRLLDHLETTASFRIAGDPISKARLQAKADVTEFDVEDKPFEPDASDDAVGDDGFSSDEDPEKLVKSRAERMRTNATSAHYTDPRLSLRWLVLDEADRLMDMGFEPQIQKIIAKLDERLSRRKQAQSSMSDKTRFYDAKGKVVPKMPIPDRTTVLCSATMESSVKNLAGKVLRDPIQIQGRAEEDDAKLDTPAANVTQHLPPAQLTQSAIVVPPKLRFVLLVSLLRSFFAKEQKSPKNKVLVFLSSTDVVDFYFDALGKMSMDENGTTTKEKNKLVANSILIPDAPIYRLHGNLDMQTRINSLQGFIKSPNAILLCTSLASRGLDVPFVRHVVQYDLPTEGGIKEYVHRVGRTARAGQEGDSWAFVLPSEQEWLPLCEANSRSVADLDITSSPLRHVDVTTILQRGFGGSDSQQTETRATDVQMAFERWVEKRESNGTLAKNAFVSHVRAYATHPSSEKHIFHVRLLHLGHLAKSFGLREAPAGMGRLIASKAVPLAPSKKTQQDTRKRKQQEPTSSSDDDVGGGSDFEQSASKRPKIPKSGRAVTAKRMHAINSNDRSEFNTSTTADLERLLARK